jgi:Ras-related protein Rab-11A
MNIVTMLVGNKCDLETLREVPIEESKALAEAEKLFFIETSALNATNENDVFHVVIRGVHKNMNRKSLNSNSYKSKLLSNISTRVILVQNGDVATNTTLKNYASF